MPSTQKPEMQSVARVHTAPRSSRLTHVPPVHSAPGAQSCGPLQPTAQLPSAAHSAPLQSGSAETAAAGAQVPGVLPLHCRQGPLHDVAQHTPSTQKPEEQAAAEPQALPSGCFAAQLPPST